MKRLLIIALTLIAAPVAAESLGEITYIKPPPEVPEAPTENIGARDLVARLNGDWIIVVKASEGDTITHHLPLAAVAMPYTGTVTAAHNRGEYRYACEATLPTGARIECEEIYGGDGWRFIGSMTTTHRFDGILIYEDIEENIDAMMIKVW